MFEVKLTYFNNIPKFLFLSVYGALIGKQSSRTLEVCNSFELSYACSDSGDIIIDQNYYYTKEEQCKFWYCFSCQ